MDWTPEQAAIVGNPLGAHALVHAAPGVIHLIEQADVERIRAAMYNKALQETFTERRGRAGISGVKVTTFDALGLEALGTDPRRGLLTRSFEVATQDTRDWSQAVHREYRLDALDSLLRAHDADRRRGQRLTARARTLMALLLLTAATAGCSAAAPPREPARAADTVCDVLATDAGADAARFAPHFPVAVGGAVLVFAGDHTKMVSLLDGFGLADVRVVACPAGGIVAFVPGVDARGASELERALAKAGAVAAVRERHVFAPADRPAAGRGDRARD